MYHFILTNFILKPSVANFATTTTMMSALLAYNFIIVISATIIHAAQPKKFLSLKQYLQRMESTNLVLLIVLTNLSETLLNSKL